MSSLHLQQEKDHLHQQWMNLDHESKLARKRIPALNVEVISIQEALHPNRSGGIIAFGVMDKLFT